MAEEDKKLVKVSFEYRLSDGGKQIRFLEGEALKKWQDWIKQVCLLAEIHGDNPNWGSLDWQEETKKNDF